jgi:hypothetical protein
MQGHIIVSAEAIVQFTIPVAIIADVPILPARQGALSLTLEFDDNSS